MRSYWRKSPPIEFFFAFLTSTSRQMTTVDVSKLSYVELVQLSKQLDEQIQSKRTEELKVVADGFAKKLEAAGFSVAEGIEALRPYLASEERSKKSGGASAPARVRYQDPNNAQNTWSGRGRAAGWLAAYEAQGHSRDEFKVSD